MRVPILLLALTLAAMLAGAVTVHGEVVNTEQELTVPDPDAHLKDQIARLTVPVPEVAVDMDHLWAASTAERPLVERLTIGVLRSRVHPESKQVRWERCGEEVAEDDLVFEAALWAAHFLAALEEVERQTGVALNPWGAFATMANESGMNECALCFAARKWAATHVGKVLITETWRGRTATRKVEKKVVDKFRLTYDRDTVWGIVTHPDFAKGKVQVKMKSGKVVTMHMGNKFDGGPWQMRYSMKHLTREQFDQLTSIVPGLYIGAEEMARRALFYSSRYRVRDPHPRPWMLWPGADPFAERNLWYNSKITTVARWLGATREEMPLWIPVVTEGRKRTYRMEGVRVR
ncbi:MAG: hypothetical protein WC683_01235 [bacterium]